MSEADSRIRFGIVGAGYIAEIVASALKEAGVDLVAVASRRHESANAFAERHGGVRVFRSWHELVEWDGLEAVYVATPTAVREEICVAAARCGKHVLAEKPFASLPSLQRVTHACRANNVAFMDATHFVHHPRTRQLQREAGERIGQLRAIYSAFFFPSMDTSNIRHRPALEPTGAHGDMAWYSMRAIVEFASPDAVLVDGSGFAQMDDDSGACLRSAGALMLSDGCTLTWDAGYNVGACVMDLKLFGSRGLITLDDFVLDWTDSFADNIPSHPVGFTQRSGIVNPTGFEEISTPSPQPQVVCMIRNFVDLTGDPNGEAAQAHRHNSERTQGLLDAVWDQLARI